MQQTEKRHVTGQLNNMQIEWRQWIALGGVARPAESATGSLRASTREYETIWPAASNSKPSDPLMDRSSARVLAVRSELNEQTFFFPVTHSDFVSTPVFGKKTRHPVSPIANSLGHASHAEQKQEIIPRSCFPFNLTNLIRVWHKTIVSTIKLCKALCTLNPYISNMRVFPVMLIITLHLNIVRFFSPPIDGDLIYTRPKCGILFFCVYVIMLNKPLNTTATSSLTAYMIHPY